MIKLSDILEAKDANVSVYSEFDRMFQKQIRKNGPPMPAISKTDPPLIQVMGSPQKIYNDPADVKKLEASLDDSHKPKMRNRLHHGYMFLTE